MLIADIVRLLLTAILAALALGGHPLFWQLCVIAVPLGAFGGVFIPALLFPQILQIAFLHKIARILVHPLLLQIVDTVRRFGREVSPQLVLDRKTVAL
jgi:hypothetical protein